MGRRNRFVTPKTTRLEISDGDYIDIKRELTVREEKQMFGKALKRMGGIMGETAEIQLDPIALRFAKVEEYLVGWSFEGDELDDKGKPTGNGVPVELTQAAIEGLEVETFEEIELTIEGHREKMAEEKKASGGKVKSAKT